MYEWTGLSRGRALALVSARDPRAHPWGLFSRDSPEPPLAGAGAFLWFATREESAAFVADVVPHLLLDEDEPPFARLAEATRDVAGRAGGGEMPLAEAIAHLTAIWSGAAVFEWWGELAELSAGDAPFARRVRAEYRGRRGDDGGGPVAGPDLAAFTAFLAAYA